MVVQTISDIKLGRDFLSVLQLFEQKQIGDIRINLCKFDIEESIKMCRFIKNYVNETECHLSFFLDLPYPYNKSRVKDYYLDDDKNIHKGRRYKILFGKQSSLEKINTIVLESTGFISTLCENKVIYYADGEGGFKCERIHKDYVEVVALNSFYIINGKAISCGLLKCDPNELQPLFDLISDIKAKVFLMPSFVTCSQEIIELRERLKKDVVLLPKIETREAIGNYEEILEYSDGILLARGDLALSVDLRDLYIIEKRIVRNANNKNKLIFCATDILIHMENRLIPERSELFDVLSLIDLGVSNFILSGINIHSLLTETSEKEENLLQIKNKVDFIKRLKEEKDYGEKAETVFYSGETRCIGK